jgi:hypothetical protein
LHISRGISSSKSIGTDRTPPSHLDKAKPLAASHINQRQQQQEQVLAQGGMENSPGAHCSSIHEVDMDPKEVDENGEPEHTWTPEEEAQALRKLDWNLIPL